MATDPITNFREDDGVTGGDPVLPLIPNKSTQQDQSTVSCSCSLMIMSYAV